MKRSAHMARKFKEGVVYSELNNKWQVLIKNTTWSKYTRPVVVHSQFKKQKDAVEQFNKLKNSKNERYTSRSKRRPLQNT
jgi:hypothetical protein